MELVVLVLAVLGGLVVLPIVALIRTNHLSRELRRLEAQLQLLERRSAAAPVKSERIPAHLEASAPLDAVPASAPPLPPVSHADTAPTATQTHWREAAISDTPNEPERAHSEQDFEQRVGGVWLQNAGVLVLLLGIFFFILWGYTTGRFGPGVLVAAGVALGLVSAWHGTRVARTLPRLGNAFVGMGAGAVYLSLYLGHFTLRVLSLPFAIVALLATAFATVELGLRRRVQIIALLGVIGAFLPPLTAAWLSLKGFSLTPAQLLTYMAGVNVLVFLLASRAGWSALVVSALVLTTLVWGSTFPHGDWSLVITIGLTVMFTALGIAPLPRLLLVEGRVRGVDLMVVGGAPFLLWISIVPWLEQAPPMLAAILCLGAGALQLGAAWYVDLRRPERDLWRPLTGAAALFATVGLQHAVSQVDLAVAWAIEGSVLVLLGLAPRAGWLRVCGYLVLAGGVVRSASDLLLGTWTPAGATPVVHLASIRLLVIVVMLEFGVSRLKRAQERLHPLEEAMPGVWLCAANVLLAGWVFRVSGELGDALESPGGRWSLARIDAVQPANVLRDQLQMALQSFGWAAQSCALLVQGIRMRWRVPVAASACLAAMATIALFVETVLPDGWTLSRMPVLHPSGVAALAALATLLIAGVILWRNRESLGLFLRSLPELSAAGVLTCALAWIVRESDHVARTLTAPGGAFAPGGPLDALALTGRLGMVRASLTSTAWLCVAGLTLAIGWRAGSAFLRWAALALIGLTLLKFALVDLAEADVFWRFLTAIAAGVAMIGVSYLYQRKGRRTSA